MPEACEIKWLTCTAYYILTELTYCLQVKAGFILAYQMGYLIHEVNTLRATSLCM